MFQIRPPAFIGDAQITQPRQRAGVEVDDVELAVHVHLLEGPEETEARGVDQHVDLRPLLFEKLAIGVQALALLQIPDQRADRIAALRLQLLEPVFPPGDDPDLVKVFLPVQRVHEFPAHAGGRAGDHGDLHKAFTPCQNLLLGYHRQGRITK